MNRCVIALSVCSFVALQASESWAAGDKRVSPLRADTSAELSNLAGGQSALTLAFDQAAYDALRSAEHAVIDEFSLSPEQSVSLDLQRIEAFTADAQLVVARIENGKVMQTPLAKPDVAVFGGTVVGDAESRVFLSFSPHGNHGYIRTAGQTHVISSGMHGQNGPTLIYNRDALAAADPQAAPGSFTCGADELKENAMVAPPVVVDDGGIAGTPPCRQIQLAVETDYEFLNNLFGGNEFAASAYVATLIGAVTEIYTEDVNSRVQVSFLRLWTTSSDPWTANNTSNQLIEFRNYWNANMDAVPRSLAHMLSGRSLGGGIAYLNAICHDELGYAVSANLAGTFPYPLQSNNSQNWDIMVVSHELGHNFGSPHTHNYAPPIDGCGNGDCTDANLGTIMSYCHQCSGGMSNIVIDMHPTVSSVILNYLDSLDDCNLTGEGIGPVAAADFYVVAQGQTTTLDVLANDVESNCDTIQLFNHDANSAGGGIVTLSPGSGPDGRDELIYSPTPSFLGTDRFSYSITDSEDLFSGATVNINVIATQSAASPTQTQPGVKTRYYALNDPQALPNFSVLSPYLAETVPAINFPSTGGVFAGSGLADNFGAVYTGYISLAQAGLYTFYLESDDGSRLWIGNTLVVDNDGLHAMLEKSGSVGLSAGMHKLRVEFFERGGGAGVIARYAANGLNKQVIPAAILYRNVSADVNESGSVNVDDLLTIINGWGACGVPSAACAGDVTGNGSVDVDDLLAVINAWG